MMQIPLSAIRSKYQHLYYQDGPVKVSHLTATVAKAAKRAHARVMLVGLAPAPPPPLGNELNSALSQGQPHHVDIVNVPPDEPATD